MRDREGVFWPERAVAIFLTTAMGVSAMAFAKEHPEDKLLARFDVLVQGEFDNYNQVNFETNDFLEEGDRPDEKHARLYQRVVRIDAPKLGTHVYYAQTHSGGREFPVYRQGIMVVRPDYERGLLVAENLKLESEQDYTNLWERAALTELGRDDVRALGEDCEFEIRMVGDTFVGVLDQARCRVVSRRGLHLAIRGEWILSASGAWHSESGYDESGNQVFGRTDGVPHKLRRARRFSCWAAFKTDRTQPNGEPEWDFFADLSLHNQGDIAEFTTTSADPKRYFMRLKETVFPAGERPDVLEIFVHENTDEAKRNYGEALSYTWTEASSNRLGLNLRWMQSSCSASP